MSPILSVAMTSDWVTVAEVAALLRLNPETIRRLLRRGELVGHNFGGRGGYRISRQELERYLQSLGKQPPPRRRKRGSK
jgi:excisionase family DNA binding protein